MDINSPPIGVPALRKRTITVLILLWLAVNIADVAWIYYYVYASIYSRPRIAINKTGSGWDMYGIWMVIIGSILGFINIAVTGLVFNTLDKWIIKVSDPAKRRLDSAGNPILSRTPLLWERVFGHRIFRVAFYMFYLLVLFPAALVLIFGPVFSPFIAEPIVHNKAWAHGCDKYTVEVELEGQWNKAPDTQLSRASFYHWRDNVRTQSFEYVMSRGDAPEGWSFQLRTTPDTGGIPNEISPLIKQVSYEFVSGTISGNCTAAGSPTTNETTPCLQGFVDLGDFLSFHLNDTRTNTVSNLQAVHKYWTFDDNAPSVLLRRVNESSQGLGDTVLVTTVTKPGQCNSLKICMETASSVEMIAPIGIILKRLDAYGIYCTGGHH